MTDHAALRAEIAQALAAIDEYKLDAAVCDAFKFDSETPDDCASCAESEPLHDLKASRDLLRRCLTALAETPGEGWRPIESAPPIQWKGVGSPAWLYSPQFGVQAGEIGNWPDGPRGRVGGFNGCAVRDWGVTLWMPNMRPTPPPEAG